MMSTEVKDTGGTEDGTNQEARSHLGRRKRVRELCLAFTDAVLVSVVLSPVIVAQWRGVWVLADIYLYPENLQNSAFVSLVIGFVGHLAFTLCQDRLATLYHPEKKPILYFLVSRVYTAVYGCVCVHAWRGLWVLLDLHAGNDVATLSATIGVCVAAQAATLTLCNLAAPPFVFFTDRPEGYFNVAFRFRNVDSKCLKVLNALFGIVIVGNLNVIVWRSVWSLMDVVVYPEDKTKTALTSLLFGYSVIIFAFCLQPIIKRIYSNANDWRKIALADFYQLFALSGTISIWRGVWYLIDIYLSPDYALLGNWLTAVLCLVFLIAIQCSNSVLFRGVSIDAEDTGEEKKDNVFTWSYLRTFLPMSEDHRITCAVDLADLSELQVLKI